MMIMLLAALQGALVAPAALRAGVEAFAGVPARVDPRLLLPMCPAPEFGWAVPGRSVVVHCAAPEWRVFVPVAGGAMAAAAPVAAASAATPAIRRGDRVVVEAGGPGFVIGLEAVAEADARDGRVSLRAAGGGRRLSGVVGADGRVRIHGLSAMVNRR